MSEETIGVNQLRKHKTVRDALVYVAEHELDPNQAPIDTPVWELIGRTLFEIANNPNAKVRGSMARATKAQRMISERLVGTRRPGTHPARAVATTISFVDLAAGALPEGEEP